MDTSRSDFYRAILANRQDDAPRLVYADWLQENGEEERAEFIRIQIAAARSIDGETHAFAARIHELLCENDNAYRWGTEDLQHILGGQPEVLDAALATLSGHEQFERGFLGYVPLTTEQIYRLMNSLPTHVKVTDNPGGYLQNFSWPVIQQITHLSLSNTFLTDYQVEGLFASPYVRENLEVLDLSENDLTQIPSFFVASDTNSAPFKKLHTIILRRNRITAIYNLLDATGTQVTLGEAIPPDIHTQDPLLPALRYVDLSDQQMEVAIPEKTPEDQRDAAYARALRWQLLQLRFHMTLILNGPYVPPNLIVDDRQGDEVGHCRTHRGINFHDCEDGVIPRAVFHMKPDADDPTKPCITTRHYDHLYYLTHAPDLPAEFFLDMQGLSPDSLDSVAAFLKSNAEKRCTGLRNLDPKMCQELILLTIAPSQKKE
jgi:uncharacterized protein (TIGR02996 family)